MTIFTLTGEHRAAVLECGTNTRGEIPKLAQIVEPDVAMVLNVDLEHSEGLGTLDDIADEEAALFSTATQYAVASADEPMVLARIPKHLRRITFGKSPDAHVRLVSRSAGARSRIRVELAREMVAPGVEPFIETEIALLGEAAALNCTAAIAGAAAMRAAPLESRELDAIAAALAGVMPVAGRLASTSINGIFVIDDTYNSNPRSIRAALAAAREVADGLGARLVIAMGDMLELGDQSAAAHQEAIRDVMRARPAAFVAVGPEMNSALRDVSPERRRRRRTPRARQYCRGKNSCRIGPRRRRAAGQRLARNRNGTNYRAARLTPINGRRGCSLRRLRVRKNHLQPVGKYAFSYRVKAANRSQYLFRRVVM